MRKIFNLRRGAAGFARAESGTQFVEVAIVLPLLLILLGGTFEFAHFYYNYTTLKTAVRAGARHACKWRKEDSWTVPETRNMVVYGDFSDTSKGPIMPGLAPSHIQITANGPTNRVESVTVQVVGYKYKPLFDLGGMIGVEALSLKIDLNPSVTMKQLFHGPVA